MKGEVGVSRLPRSGEMSLLLDPQMLLPSGEVSDQCATMLDSAMLLHDRVLQRQVQVRPWGGSWLVTLSLIHI